MTDADFFKIDDFISKMRVQVIDQQLMEGDYCIILYINKNIKYAYKNLRSFSKSFVIDIDKICQIDSIEVGLIKFSC